MSKARTSADIPNNEEYNHLETFDGMIDEFKSLMNFINEYNQSKIIINSSEEADEKLVRKHAELFFKDFKKINVLKLIAKGRISKVCD